MDRPAQPASSGWRRFRLLTLLGIAVAAPDSGGSQAGAWERHAFPLPESIWSVAAVDLDGDGRLELIAMGERTVFALQAPEWKPQPLLDTKEPKMLYCVALDADQDGDSDLFLGRYRVPWIEYREAQKAGRAADEPVGPDFSIAWIENQGRIGPDLPLHIIDRELNGIHGLCAGDVNSDGRIDFAGGSINGPSFANSLFWFQGLSAKAGFSRHIVTRGGADGRPHYLELADMNRNGRPDLLVGDSGGGTFTIWEQPAEPGGAWKKNLVAVERGATNVRASDVDGDGDMDLIGSCGHGKGVFWFAAPDWKKMPVDPGLSDPHALAVGDFDGDGDSDVAAASFTSMVTKWYENDGTGRFTAHEIDSGNRQQAYDLKAVDLDGDGRLDLILAGRESRNVVWYRNLTPSAREKSR